MESKRGVALLKFVWLWNFKQKPQKIRKEILIDIRKDYERQQNTLKDRNRLERTAEVIKRNIIVETRIRKKQTSREWRNSE